MIIAREKEKRLLDKYYTSTKAEFIVVKGRRRVGKTFLIKEFFHNSFFFSFTGILGSSTATTLSIVAKNLHIEERGLTWFSVFDHLREKLMEQTGTRKKVIFLDEISWLDTPNSDFIKALEYAWNSYFSDMKDLLIIVSGSATTWIMNNLINNTGGLYRRITGIINLLPFQLHEVKEFFRVKGIVYSDIDICEVYSLFGGIPQYLEYFDPSLSVSQNVDEIVFKENAILKNELKTIYSSLFHSSDKYIDIIRALTSKRKGLTQEQILQVSKLVKNGNFSSMLRDLCESGIVRQYFKYPNKSRQSIYQLVDNFTCFATYFEQEIGGSHFSYAQNRSSQRIRIFLGFAFERVCLWHIGQIERGLRLDQIAKTISSYRGEHSQIDLIFERADRVISLIEIKWSDQIFEIDEDYYQVLLTKKSDFVNENKIHKTVTIHLITTFGVRRNNYASMVSSDMTLADLFLPLSD